MNDENFTLLNLNISEASWPILIKFYVYHHWGGWHKVLGQTGSKLCFPWQQKAPIDYNGENDVSIFPRLFFIRSFLYLQVMRTCIKSRMRPNFGQIGPLTTELAVLEVSNISQRLIMGKWCLHASSFISRRNVRTRNILVCSRKILVRSRKNLVRSRKNLVPSRNNMVCPRKKSRSFEKYSRLFEKYSRSFEK